MILITQPRVGFSHHEIIAMQMAAHSLDWEVYPAEQSWRIPEEMINSKAKGVPYGSWTFAEVIAQQMGWSLKKNSFDWLAKLPHKYLKRQVDFMTLEDAKKITERKFIKPADDKCFPAVIYEGNFNPPDIIANDYPTLVSDVVSWDLEFRCFVKDGQVLTWSNYLYFGEINSNEYANYVPPDLEPITDFVQAVLSDIPTEPSVVDVGVIPGKGWAVIETNEAYASGIYHCDPSQVLKVLEATCERIV